MTEPNAIWTADFKGQFKTRDGEYCYPLTLVDGYSRFLLACQSLRSTAIALARPVFQRVFAKYGLPHRQRRPLSHDRARPPFAVVGVVDSPRHLS